MHLHGIPAKRTKTVRGKGNWFHRCLIFIVTQKGSQAIVFLFPLFIDKTQVGEEENKS